MTQTAVPIDPALDAWLARPALAAEDGATLSVEDPGTERAIASVPVAGPAEVDDAVARARETFERVVARYDAAARARVMWRIGDRLDALAEPLAQLLTLEVGKRIDEARAEVARAAETFRYFAGWATKVGGHTLPSRPGFSATTWREPVGVCAAIAAWNFPLEIAAWKLGPALATGNAVVLKPAEQTPLTSLWLEEIAAECGLEDGALVVLTGPGEPTGAALVAHPDVAKISFTGSVEVGRLIERAAAERPTRARITLELGGKSPNIVFADADLALAGPGAAAAIFANQGQVCCAGSRVFVEAPAFEALTEELAARADALRIGHGLEPETELGPLVSKAQLERVTGLVAGARSAGASLIAGDRPVPDAGHFCAPTVLQADAGSEIARREVFGPVVTVHEFTSEHDLPDLLGGTGYDLAAGFWTRDVDRAHRVARALRAGSVWINCWGAIEPGIPFGGLGGSGVGRELGREALAEYTHVKAVVAAVGADGLAGAGVG